MKRIFEFFKKKWVISLIGLIALSALIWFIGPLIAIADTVPLEGQVSRLLLIIVIIVIWGLNNLRVQVQENRANKQMMEGLTESEAGTANSATGAQSAEEVAVLKERFDEALTVLKKSGTKGSTRSLYELPWYIIIGPPGSGKTTALVNSGLNFPLAERFGKEALRGVGGTRNCDWWFTDEAVLLDTAGRYVTQDSQAEVDSVAWGGFLTLLKKHRQRRPINGALVAISLSDLMLQNEQERLQHIRAIKQRLQELNAHLGVRFPVYVLFTKCDLIAGFAEYFDNLGREEREQVWGITFPIEDQKNAGVSIQGFSDEFDALVQRLNDRLLWRMNQERDEQRRARIYGFPQQMAGLKESIERFLQEIFNSSRFEEPLLLRGTYFTSGTQEGTPIDRLMSSLGRTFGLSSQSMPSHSGQGRSYFLTSLLQDVVFKEADLAGANRRLEIQRAWLQRAAYAGAVGATILAVVAWSTSFTRNQVYINRMEDRVEEYKKVAIVPLQSVADFEEVLPRLKFLREAELVYGEYQEGTPLLMGMGLYQGNKLTEVAHNAYVREMHDIFLPRIGARLEQHLEAGFGDPDFQYEALKAYLMLGNPEHIDPELIGTWMSLDWQSTFANSPEKQGQLQAYINDLLQAGIQQPLQLNGALIDSVRLGLNQMPRAELMYGRAKRDYIATDKQPFRVSDAAGVAGRKVFVRDSGAPLEQGLTGLFTYNGYHDFFKKELKNIVAQSNDEYWVLDTERKELTRPELESLEKNMQDLYFADYIRSWNQLLSDISIVQFNNTRHAAEVLNLLSGPTSPMRSLLQAVKRNTSLEGSGGLAAAALEKAGAVASTKSRFARLMESATSSASVPKLERPAEVVDRQFEPLNTLVGSQGASAPLDQILNLLSQLYGQMDAAAGGMSSEAATGGSNDLMRRVQVEGARQPEPVKHWLQQLTTNSRTAAMGDARIQVNREWSSGVLPVCGQALDGRYPFHKGARQETTLADFGRFFGPGGIMDQFFKKNLKPYVDTSQRTWKWRSLGGGSLGIPDDVLRQFQRAAVIRDTFFQAGGQLPSVNFGLKPVHLDANVYQFLLDLEGQKFNYRHGPTRVYKAQWPGPESTGQVRVVFEDSNGAQASVAKDGVWAWFRLLDDMAELKTVSADRIMATFDVNGRKAVYEIRASSVVNPFMMKEMQQFRCPGSL